MQDKEALDLADGLKLGLITPEQIPELITTTLGKTPDKMIDALVKDLIRESNGKKHITMSAKVRDAMDALFDFNYKHIYFSEKNRAFVPTIRNCLEGLYEHYTKEENLSPQKAIDAIILLTDRQALEILKK
ncbi:hypothetical protein A2276_02120 [candidate division WOR-1 bacterium RIFOXYA12_FULL_43_27]|uniref:Uncharacterized protein n=1 Tax=candidate division WOR-1 bacterium RIFOXYC2_FULL_46_14 TaxID=1802587 RepID=A0A1F4U6P3_UNCSA|nr:MAG: hypothetical protein A2276_02120 [candidate division WOR-1 bacterium RIFOXYA12_FULL_43_27]OGC19483.1 MAG: hypothetical protein A2292_02210 [candidate division WOR-1 bacterium RIFOXYB2_FULL_46_45]OGC30471.1 MAG: hypothetical protein A2232_02210 [candidate division WOR-1 bacterium RIFOXYA2_FULL_46_56]OGC40539.1 MAG: hypothetical protein A2438_05925 [candidate division WOR-1 bacterium RIFOXYC2_FULL_46_14]